LAAPSHISDEDVELVIGTEGDYSTVMVTARRLGLITLTWRHRSTVILEGTQLDQIMIKGEVISIPNEAIHAIAQ
jgi:hypothetical protein